MSITSSVVPLPYLRVCILLLTWEYLKGYQGKLALTHLPSSLQQRREVLKAITNWRWQYDYEKSAFHNLVQTRWPPKLSCEGRDHNYMVAHDNTPQCLPTPRTRRSVSSRGHWARREACLVVSGQSQHFAVWWTDYAVLMSSLEDNKGK